MSSYKVDNIDGSVSIQDPADSTKKIKFNLSNISADATRILTVPNNSLTMVGESTSQTLTNKTVDADSNTVSNIDNGNIKAGATIDASKIADGSVSNTKFQYLSGLTSAAAGISNTQTLTNKTLTDASTYLQNNADNTKKVQFNLSLVNTDTTRTLTVPNASTTLVGTAVTQTLTNKTLDTANNTLTVAAGDIASGTLPVARGGTGASTLTADGILRGNGTSAITSIKSNWGASTAPTATDDTNSGYEVGSRWIDTTADKEYICLNSTALSAVWTETTSQGESDHTNLSNIGTNTHSQIDSHIADSSIHETITASNLTGDQGIFSSKSGTDLQFKSLKQGTNVTMSADANAITINCANGLNWSGAWVSQNYVIGDGVEYNGTSYVCKLNTVSNEVPTNTTYWDILAVKGSDGSSGITTSVLSAITSTSTTSSSYVVINSMTITPASGTYLVSFSASGNLDSGSANANYAIHNNGTVVSHSSRKFGWSGGKHTNGFEIAMHSQAEISVTGSEAIDVRFHTKKNSTFTINERSMILLKVA